MSGSIGPSVPIGLAGTPATSVLSVQGITGGKYIAALNVDSGGTALDTTGPVAVMPGSPTLRWSYAAASGGISNTNTAVTIIAAAGGGVRNYLTALQINTEAFTTAAEFAIRDGAAGTVLWRVKVPTTGFLTGFNVNFNVPLRSTANTLLEVLTITASGGGALFFNAQGYQAA